MSSRPFFLQAEIRGETMVGFYWSGSFYTGQEWRPADRYLRRNDVNYCFTEHILPPSGTSIHRNRLRVLYTRWLNDDEIFWVEEHALRYWLQHDIVLWETVRNDLRHFFCNRIPAFLGIPTVITREQYNGYQNTLAQRSDYIMNLSEIALALAMGNHHRLGAASVLLMLSREEMTIIWNTVCPP